MGKFIAQRAVKEIIQAGHPVLGCVVTVLGLTFKEDCPDLRNSKVVDIIEELQDYGIKVQVCDPLADPAEALHEYGVALVPLAQLQPAVAVVAAVAHSAYRGFTAADFLKLTGEHPVLVDVKGTYRREEMQAAGIRIWSL
jgi:UDP-N-acetyl-D-glucosamine/UDP-N-acetyl-D-galactosamine dehydrogenase